MGWLFPMLFGVAALMLLWRSGRCSRSALELAFAAILIALAGYAWQGSPTMAGVPHQSVRQVNFAN